MNLIELIFFLMMCTAFGFIGHLVSPRYGWVAGAVLAVPVLILLISGTVKEIIKQSRRPRGRS